MKANKIFASVLAALTIFGLASCNKDKGKEVESLQLTPTSMTLKVGETGTITANIAVEKWESNNEAVATVANGVVTAIAEGNAFISATAKGETKTCVVLVEKASAPGGDEEDININAKRIWPIVLDETTTNANSSKIAGDLTPKPENNLDIWAAGETYNAGDGTGKNYYGHTDGYVSLVAACPAGWCGGGFVMHNAESIQAMKDLKDAIVANPDKVFLHIGMKATTNGNYQFYTFGEATTSFAIGTQTIEAGAVIGNFERDGEWHGFDIPMAQFANAISAISISETGHYILSFLGGNAPGSQLNLDAVYFYEKE